MMFWITSPWTSLLAGLLPIGIVAKDCYTQGKAGSPGANTLRLDSPEQLRVFDGCTSIIGDIYVTAKFSGSLILNGVKSFKGTISSYDWLSSESTVFESLEMPDAVYVKEISLSDERQVKRVYLPKVQSMEEVYLFQPGDGSSVELSALRQIGSLLMVGGWSRISLPALYETRDQLEVLAEAPVEIISGLRYAAEIKLSGELKGLDFTSLSQAQSVSINSTIPSRCSSSLVHLYRKLYHDKEADFCDPGSLELADENRPRPSSYPNPSPTPSSTPWVSPTPNGIPPKPTPSPSVSKVPDLDMGTILLYNVIGCAVIVCVVVWYYRRDKQQLGMDEGGAEIKGAVMPPQLYLDDTPPGYSVDSKQ
ncbi:hypothetical protein BJX65DRAFT_312305 [Aspergillus insuetus]